MFVNPTVLQRDSTVVVEIFLVEDNKFQCPFLSPLVLH